jgi:hypothetical protein
MQAVDVFKSNAFSMISLTDGINKVPFIPGQVMRLGLYKEIGISTTSIMLEEVNGILYLVENKPRGAAGQRNQAAKRTARNLQITHLPVSDTIMADEIQDVRAFGNNSALSGAQSVIDSRTATMSNSLDATIEHLALGSVKGQILDSDGSTVIYDLFTEFGVVQAAVVNFDLDNANPTAGVFRKKCADILRTMSVNLGGTSVGSAHAFCGSAFFDDLIAHPEIRETYLAHQGAAQLREGYYAERFYFGGIVWEEYRGSVSGVDFINADECHIFPVGVPGLFKMYYGPADYMETVNTIGLPKYMKSAVDSRFGKFVDLEAQSNPLPICTQPKSLIKGKRT